MGSWRVGHDWVTSLSLSCIGEGNGNPLQCSCPENSRDGGAWWAAVYGVAQSRTWLKLLSSSSSRALLRLLIFLLEILIPACALSSLAFHMMYSAYKLNKQGDNIQPWHTPFPIWNQSIVPCPVLTVASGPAYRFLRRQVRWSGILNSLRIFKFVVIHIVKEAEVGVFLELP